MALSANKKFLASQILPEVDFNITSTGITIPRGERFSTARFIPFDHPGKCKECKATEVEIDFAVTKEGVTIYCSRIKGPRFIPCDTVRDLPEHCFFKIRNKGRVFNVQHGLPQNCVPMVHQITLPPSPVAQVPLPTHKPVQIPPPQPVQVNNNESVEMEIQQFFDSLAAATAGIPAQTENLQLLAQQAEETQSIAAIAPPVPAPDQVLQEFYDSLSAATTGIPTQAEKLQQLVKQADEMETNAVIAAPVLPQVPIPEQDVLQFFDSLSAATAGIPAIQMGHEEVNPTEAEKELKAYFEQLDAATAGIPMEILDAAAAPIPMVKKNEEPLPTPEDRPQKDWVTPPKED